MGARYPQGGGLTAERQALRERVRMQAAARFADGEDSTAVAKALRVHVRSVQRRWAALQVGGEAALVSKSPRSAAAVGGCSSLPPLCSTLRPTGPGGRASRPCLAAPAEHGPAVRP